MIRIKIMIRIESKHGGIIAQGTEVVRVMTATFFVMRKGCKY
jgi:hypothetical protein